MLKQIYDIVKKNRQKNEGLLTTAKRYQEAYKTQDRFRGFSPEETKEIWDSPHWSYELRLPGIKYLMYSDGRWLVYNSKKLIGELL